MAQHGDDDVVSVGKDVGADLDSFAYGAFDGKAPAINLGPNVLDDNAANGRLTLTTTNVEFR